jgi:hypothetical protein
MKKVSIYALIDPFTGEIRYVGKTIKKLSERLRNHLFDKDRYPNRYVCKWLSKVCKLGGKPIIKLIEECNELNYQEREKYWVNYYRNKFKLCNLTEGGEGAPKRNNKNNNYKPVNKLSKKIYCYDLNGNFFKIYNNLKEAVENTPGSTKTKIVACCRNRRSRHANFYWAYCEKTFDSNYKTRVYTNIQVYNINNNELLFESDKMSEIIEFTKWSNAKILRYINNEIKNKKEYDIKKIYLNG